MMYLRKWAGIKVYFRAKLPIAFAKTKIISKKLFEISTESGMITVFLHTQIYYQSMKILVNFDTELTETTIWDLTPLQFDLTFSFGIFG